MHGERVWAISWLCSRIVTIADLDKRRAARKAMEAKATGTGPSHSARERWVVKTLRKPAIGGETESTVAGLEGSVKRISRHLTREGAPG